MEIKSTLSEEDKIAIAQEMAAAIRSRMEENYLKKRIFGFERIVLESYYYEICA